MDQQSCSIPTVFAPKYYAIDPATEDLIFGDQLSSGMVVLVEKTRTDPDNYDETNRAEYQRLMEDARWCRVTGLRRVRDVTVFIGEYADGTMMSRTYNNEHTWFVKKASMPS